MRTGEPADRIAVTRIYAPRSEDDGYRVLVDRLWPRGVRPATAALDLWLGAIAPSTELRRWYGHEVSRWRAFRERYWDELAAHGDLLDRLLEAAAHHDRATLLYAARDEEHHEAQVLAEILRKRSGTPG